jgi:ABC-type amino acid transport substrate-binding protein
MSITEEREKKVSFTIPYYSNMLTFIGKQNAEIVRDSFGRRAKADAGRRLISRKRTNYRPMTFVRT